MSENPYFRGLLFIIRAVAFGMIVISLLLLGSLLFFAVGHRHPPGKLGTYLLRGLPLLVGIVLLFFSRSIAKKWTDNVED